jgi:short-subunit dehydrogenase
MAMDKMYTVITGGSEGIGYALAEKFAMHGHNLVLIARNEAKLQLNQAYLQSKYSVHVLIFSIDLTSQDAFEKCTQLFNSLPIQYVINNAGFGFLGEFQTMSTVTMHEMITLNITIFSLFTHYFINRFLKEGQGSILQVGSIAGFMPGPLMSVYYATKNYVNQLSTALAFEYRNTPISISILCPGPVNTHFMKRSQMNLSMIGESASDSPMDIANYTYQRFIDGKKWIIPGIKNKILSYLGLFSPQCLVLYVINYLQTKRKNDV